jgi:hypothetical protein
MAVKANLKIILQADDTIVAESEDQILWQKILIAINTGNYQLDDKSDDEEIVEEKNVYSNKDLISSFSKYLEIQPEYIKAAFSPISESPYIHIDKHYWESIRKSLPSRGATSIPEVVIAGTILLLWKEFAKLGDTNPKEVTKVLSILGVTAKNPTRSFQNCEWLQLRNNKLYINPVETSKAKELVKSFSLKKSPYNEE